MSNKKRSPGRPAKYPPEFQRDAVAMVLDEGRSWSAVLFPDRSSYAASGV